MGINTGNAIGISAFQFTLDPSSVNANTTAEVTVTVYGLKANDIVYVNKTSHETGLGVVNARVSADNTLALTLMNNTGSGIDEASETWRGLVVRAALPLPTSVNI